MLNDHYLADVLQQIKDGKTSFLRPSEDQQTSLFDDTVDVIKYAAEIGLLGKILVHKETRSGLDRIDAVYILDGLTGEGLFYLGCPPFVPLVPSEIYRLDGRERHEYLQVRDRVLKQNRCIRWISGMVGSYDAAVAIIAQAESVSDVVSSLAATGKDTDPGQTHTQLVSDPYLAPGLQRARFLLGKPPLKILAAQGPRVFICYMDKDRGVAERLFDVLSASGARPWMDKRSLTLGDDWESEIRNAVASSDAVVVCLRSEFNAVGFRQKEVRWAVEAAQLRPPGHGFVIPFLVESCVLPDWCRPLHAGDTGQPTSSEDLIRAVEKHCNWTRAR